MSFKIKNKNIERGRKKFFPLIKYCFSHRQGLVKTSKVFSLFICLIYFLSFTFQVTAQTNKNNFYINAGFFQMKEEFNQRMVFNGPQMNVGYSRIWDLNSSELIYNPKIALGVPLNRGMIAVNINFSPIDISYLIKVYKNSNMELKTGLNFAAFYSYQEYPDLQNAHLFWFGEIGLFPCVEFNYKSKSGTIKTTLKNSVLGFVSRTEKNDPYFYSFKFSDFLVRPHQNMTFGSLDKYNHTNFQIEYIPGSFNNNSFGFGIEYISAYFNTDFQSLNYYLQWKKSF